MAHHRGQASQRGRGIQHKCWLSTSVTFEPRIAADAQVGADVIQIDNVLADRSAGSG